MTAPTGALVSGENKLAEYRVILGHALADGFGDGNSRRSVKMHPIARPDPPCWIISPSIDGGGMLVRDDERNTFCTHVARWTLMAVYGDPSKESSWNRAEDWAIRLQGVLKTVRTYEGWDKRDELPVLNLFGSPENIDFRQGRDPKNPSVEFLISPVEISAAIHI